MQAGTGAQPQVAAKSRFPDFFFSKSSDSGNSDRTFIDMYYIIILITFVQLETGCPGHLWTRKFGASDLMTSQVPSHIIYAISRLICDVAFNQARLVPRIPQSRHKVHLMHACTL